MAKLLTTREAADMLGVGTSSVKRWADEGVLPCVKTPGGHRRFPVSDIQAMLRERLPSNEVSVPVDWSMQDWIDVLVQGTSPHDVYRRLGDERDKCGAWWRVAEAMSMVLIEIGRKWSLGELSVLQEHLASERLARGLSRCAEDISPPSDAPSALLLAAEGDDHTLGLGLAELVLRESGWVTRWAGRRTPRPALASFMRDTPVQLLAVSASSSSSDRRALAEYAEWLCEVCQRYGAALVLGGAGAWPDDLNYGVRLATYQALADHANALSGR